MAISNLHGHVTWFEAFILMVHVVAPRGNAASSCLLSVALVWHLDDRFLRLNGRAKGSLAWDMSGVALFEQSVNSCKYKLLKLKVRLFQHSIRVV